MKDISVEYAHIYTNRKVGQEQELSLTILGEFKEKLESEKRTSCLLIMIDDYSFPDPSFDYVEFSAWLADKGHSPDLILRESQLIPACDIILRLLTDERLKQEISDYIKVKKYPCSLFIATWYLLRLGHIEHVIYDKALISKKLINILPSSFKPFEDRALEIIGSTPFAEAVKNIEYKFFEGRLVF